MDDLNLNHSSNNGGYNRNRKGFLSYVAVAVISSLITSLIMAYIAPVYLYGKIIPWPQSQGGGVQNQPQIIIPKGEQPNIATAVAAKVSPAVVGIVTVKLQRDFLFGYVKQEGVGSGVIVDSRGYIVTNNHVAGKEANTVTVYLSDGRKLDAKVLWSDPALDLAVIKVNANNLPTATLGDSDGVLVGETAIAIGNPLGLRFQRTVTAGIISALNRSLATQDGGILEDLIQTDASINPGNSGGPLLNEKGEVIGINTAKVTTAEGLGFAIPINIVKPVIKQIIETGKFVPTYMGIVPFDKEIAGYIEENLPEIQKGIYVYDLDTNGPAYQAGIRKGDIITHIDGVEVNTNTKLKTILYGHKPGDVIKVRFVTQGNLAKEANVRLIEKPSE